VGRIIGIDLGTTNSAAAFADGNELRMIPNDRGSNLTPSIVSVADNGDVLVGASAKNQAIIHAERTVLHVKRHMGSGKIITLGERGYSPEEVSAFILNKLRRDAEAYIGTDVTEAVVTVPAHFSEKQRQATLEAGRLAGLKIRRIINEPTAAALAYAYRWEGTQRILVYDLGGGTFDVTCLLKEKENFTVKSTFGNNSLGGVDFDDLLRNKVIETFEAESGIDFRSDPILMQQLSEVTERAKIELSSRDSALIAMPFISSGGKPVHLSYTITRREFDALIEPLLKETVKLTLNAVREAGFGMSGIDSLVLSGGSSRIPLVRTFLKRALGLDEVAMVNPDEIVAMGAALQGELLLAEGRGALLHDVTGFTLGVEIEGNQFVPLIPRNTQLPATVKKVFTTVSDRQSSVEINVLQGESHKASENESLGRFLLSGIAEDARGLPRIEVTFSVDQDGLAHVSAQDTQTGVRQRITVAPSDLTSEAGENGNALIVRVASLLKRVRELTPRAEEYVDTDFRSEIAQMVDMAEKAVETKRMKELTEARLALETVLGELAALFQEMEAGSEGA